MRCLDLTCGGGGRVFGRVHCSDSDPVGVGGGKAATTLFSTSLLPSFNKLIIIASMIFGPVQGLFFEFSLFVE